MKDYISEIGFQKVRIYNEINLLFLHFLFLFSLFITRLPMPLPLYRKLLKRVMWMEIAGRRMGGMSSIQEAK